MEILCPLHPPPPSFLKGHLGFSQTCQNISVTALLPPAPGTASFPLNTYQVIQHMATQIHNGCRLTGEMGWLKQQRNTFFSQVSFNHSQVFSVQHHSYKLVGPSLKNLRCIHLVVWKEHLRKALRNDQFPKHKSDWYSFMLNNLLASAKK